MLSGGVCAIAHPCVRAQGGDVFSIIAIQIEAMIIEGAEAMVNSFVIQPIRGLIGWFANGEPKDICIEYEKGNKFCPNSPELMEGWLGCNVDEKGPPHERCYYQRQKSICMHEADVAKRYKRLFNQDSSSEMEDQFHAIAGEEFENVPPAMLAAFKEADAQAQAAASPVGGNLPLQQAEVDKICDSTIMDSLTLDEARALGPASHDAH